MSKIVVVGANHAGTFSINTILDNYGDQNEVVVFDQNSNISFLGCGMALWIGNQISGSDGLFYANKEGLESKGYKVLSAETDRIPATYTDLTDEESIKKMNLLLEHLEDNDDVQNVWHNWEME